MEDIIDHGDEMVVAVVEVEAVVVMTMMMTIAHSALMRNLTYRFIS